MSYEDDVQHIRNLIEDTGIGVVSKKNPSALTDELSVIVASRDRLALSLKQQNIGHIIRAKGDAWQAQEITTIRSKDLHRVCFELAAYHPDLDN